MEVMSDYLNSNTEEALDVRILFDFFDSDKDGFITRQELQVSTWSYLKAFIWKYRIRNTA